MPSFDSPFLAVPAGDWLCSNDLAFAIFDGFPVSRWITDDQRSAEL